MLRMKNYNNKLILATVLGLIVGFSVVFLISNVSLAQDDPYGLSYGEATGLSSTDIRISIIRVIRVILGVLGIIALILIVYAGFIWMTSGGNANNIEKAKKILASTVIGLIIIIMAFAIVQYIFKVLEAGSGGGQCTQICNPGVCYGCSRCTGDGCGYIDNDRSCPNCGYSWQTGEFKIEDFQTSHSGSNPKQNVYWCSKVQAIYNRRVDESVFNNEVSSDNVKVATVVKDANNNVINSIKDEGSFQVMGNVTVFTPFNSQDDTNTFVLDAREKPHRKYIPKSIQDNTSEALYLSDCSLTASCEVSSSAEVQWEFEVGSEGDSLNPYIVSTYPQSSDPNNIDINVSRSPVIDVTFSEDMDVTTIVQMDTVTIGGNTIDVMRPMPGNIYLQEVGSNGQVVTQISNDTMIAEIKSNGFRFYLEAPNLLKEFTNYKITVKNIADLCGNVMEPDSYSWVFATNDRVPGVASYYPTGDNVCPDTKISISFNTSMYYDIVNFRIKTNSPDPSTYTLSPENGIVATSNNTGSGDIRGEFKVVDADPVNINNNYRVFEFIPDKDLDENTIYYINVNTDRVINVNQDVIKQAWQFKITDMSNCVCSPYISYLSKDQGPVGDCITIYGHCFKGTSSKPAEIKNIYFDSLTSIPGAGYSAGAVGTTVPNPANGGFSEGDKPEVSIEIDYQTGATVEPSNEIPFLITAGEANGPCLWSVQPDFGSRGQRDIKMTGIRFQDYSANLNTTEVYFYSGLNAFIDDIANSWKDTEIINIAVPNLAEDGQVWVKNDFGTSNGMPFDVRYCGDGIVDPGEQCDGSNFNNQTCQTQGFVGGVLSCKSDCSGFNTSQCSNAPQVIEDGACIMKCNGGIRDGESCFEDNECIGDNTLGVADGHCEIETTPSPNPFRDAIGVCLNSLIGVRFNVDIDEATINKNNVKLNQCDGDCSSGILNDVDFSFSNIGMREIEIKPDSNLEPDKTYQIKLTTGIKSNASPGIKMENDYMWEFKTNENSVVCPIERVYVQPGEKTLGSSARFDFHASPVGPYCTVIRDIGYSWDWSVGQPDLGISIALSNGSDATVLTADEKGTTYVKAQADNKYDRARINVDFYTCDTDEDCQVYCPGSICDVVQNICGPVINTLSPEKGPEGRWVTLQGCYFKDYRGSGQVFFRDEPVATYPCGEFWSDTQVLVEVPTFSNIQDSEVEVKLVDRFGLPSSSPLPRFILTSDCLSGVPIPDGGLPGICSLVPDSGKPGDQVIIRGENFGSIEGKVSFEQFEAPVSLWEDETVTTAVPDSALDGEVVVEVEDCPSNGLSFDVSSGQQGDPCDGNLNNFDTSGQDICDANNNMCWPGLYCDPADCTCQPAPVVGIVANEPQGDNVCRNAVISVSFDQEMRYSSINSQTFIVEMVGNRVINPPVSLISDWIDKVWNFLLSLFGNTGYAQGIIDGTMHKFNIDGKTRVDFTPFDLMGSSLENTKYKVTIQNGSSGVRSSLGGELASEFSWEFIVGKNVCDITQVDVNVETAESIRESVVNDYYMCAGRDNCNGDVSSGDSGNQHKYYAFARDDNGVRLAASYSWQENEPLGQDLISLSNPLDDETVFVTANPETGESTVAVTASDSNPDDEIEYGSATAAVTVINFICENPWPSMDNFPWVDSGNNCNVDGFESDCLDMTFSTYYCRDFGQMDNYCSGGDNDGGVCNSASDCPDGSCEFISKDDDLPALQYEPLIKGKQSGVCIGGSKHGEICLSDNDCGEGIGHCDNMMKYIRFGLVDDNGNSVKECAQSGIMCVEALDCPISGEACVDSGDVIAISIYNNNEHLSPAAWYSKYGSQGAAAGSGVEVDGYESVTAGQSVYINVAVDRKTNPSNDPTKEHNIFTDIFVLSYSDKAEPGSGDDIISGGALVETEAIYRQLVRNIRFNINGIDNVRMCDDGQNYCTQDSQCSSGLLGACDARKDKLVRDIARMGALNEMIYKLEKYRGYCNQNENLACKTDADCPGFDINNLNSEFCVVLNDKYPELNVGTYIKGESVSIWDSWNMTFASLLGTSLLLDPINEVIDCPDGYNNECWEQDSMDFTCPGGSHIYHYKQTDSGQGYNIYMNMEYSNNGWNPSVSGLNQIDYSSLSQPCSPGTYNIIYQK